MKTRDNFKVLDNGNNYQVKKISPYTCKLENHADADDGRCIEDNDANIC